MRHAHSPTRALEPAPVTIRRASGASQTTSSHYTTTSRSASLDLVMHPADHPTSMVLASLDRDAPQHSAPSACIGKHFSTRVAMRNALNCASFSATHPASSRKTSHVNPPPLTAAQRRAMPDVMPPPGCYVPPKLTRNKRYFRPVFAILNHEKLLECILAKLSIRDLLHFQRVCRAAKETVRKSLELRQQLFLAPASPVTRSCVLNPLLTSIGAVSAYHHVHSIMDVSDILPTGHELILARDGQLYRPECLYGHATNPTLCQSGGQGGIVVNWELRRLTRAERAGLSRSVVFPDHRSSVWKMCICQPPPAEVHVTIWSRGRSQDGSEEGRVVERFTLRAWTVKEIFERMKEARQQAGTRDVSMMAAAGGMSDLKCRARGVAQAWTSMGSSLLATMGGHGL